MIILDPISPVAVSIFGFDVRWYALAYIAGFILGFVILKKMMPDKSKKYYDDLLTYVILGVILGGRLGYVLFYNFEYYVHYPLEILAIWQGGMSFHGGMLGLVLGIFLFTRKWADGLSILDRIAVVAPIGLFFGRIANFINMEAIGRITDQPWGIAFTGGDAIARHPSQLYEAVLEGLVLFIIMDALWRFTKLRNRVGALTGIFAIFYAAFRIFCEQFRQPDVQIGFMFGTDWLTMGTLLSLFMIIVGVALLYNSHYNTSK
jgi:phosphatidylglycerol:prolipoprotein diacylglycerol transferase